MKKVLGVFGLVLLAMVMVVPGYAQVTNVGPSSGNFSPIGGSNAQAGATASATGGAGGAGGSASIVDNSRTTFTDVNTNVFNPTNIMGQTQGLINQPNQTLNPVQKTKVEVERPLLGAPINVPPDIPITNGKERRLTPKEFPNIGFAHYNGEEYVEVKTYFGSVFNRVRREDLAEDLLTFKQRILSRNGWIKDNIRIEVGEKEGGETGSTSGSAGGAGSFNVTPGSAIASTLGVFPGKTRWSADNKYYVTFYLLSYPAPKKSSSKPVVLYEKKDEPRVDRSAVGDLTSTPRTGFIN